MKQKRNSNYISIDRDELYNLYWKRKKTMNDISIFHMFCSRQTVANRLKEFGIAIRKEKGRPPAYRSIYIKDGILMCPRCDSHLATSFQLFCRECGQKLK